jgi:carotenoid 1,2-hydratase
MRDRGDEADAKMRAEARDAAISDDHAGRFRPSIPRDGRSALRPGVAQLAGFVPQAGGALPPAGALSRGRQRASGPGRADGGAVGATGGARADLGPRFDQVVIPGGYAWWYVDAFSDDGRFGLTIIAFVGSVFSPYYAWRGRRDPEDHCAINVALYGETKRWAMTERGRTALSRSFDTFALGRSHISSHGGGLDIRIDETCAPWPHRLKGRVRLDSAAFNPRTFELERAGRHLWRPIAPLARVSVEWETPRLSWSGPGYFDTNRGDEPLEAAFRSWTWSRARMKHGACVFYEAERRRDAPLSLSLGFADSGEIREVEAPARARLPRSLWRIARGTRSEGAARLLESLEDAPFYARARIAHQLAGEDAISIHETLDLDRFASPIVKAMLPFRMPRWSRRPINAGRFPAPPVPARRAPDRP